MSTQDLRGVACVRSVSVGFGNKERSKNAIFDFLSLPRSFFDLQTHGKACYESKQLILKMKYKKLAVVAHVLQNACAKFDDFTLFFAVNVTRCTKIYNARVLLFLCYLNLLVTFSFPLPLGFALSYVQVTDFINKFINKFL